MSSKQEKRDVLQLNIAIAGLIVAIFSCFIGGLALPQIQKIIEPSQSQVAQAIPSSPTATATSLPATTGAPTQVINAPTKTQTPPSSPAKTQTPASSPTNSSIPKVVWTEDATGVPPSGTEIKRNISAGLVLMFGGEKFEMNGTKCVADPQKEICILLNRASTSQTIVIQNVVTGQNRVGLALASSPEDALNENARLLWQPPNCGSGCQRALVYYFNDMQLATMETVTPK